MLQKLNTPFPADFTLPKMEIKVRLLKGIVAATFVFVSIGISYACSLAGVNEDLLEAADKGDSKTVQRCLANYADVNAKSWGPPVDDDDATALF